MKFFLFLIIIYTFLTVGCAHSPKPNSSLTSSTKSSNLQLTAAASDPEQTPLQPSPTSVKAESENVDDNYDLDYPDDTSREERVEIADPIEPLNRAMYYFNDKLYFWALKPVAEGYNKVVPEVARISAKNFFSNLGFPIRFISCLLQADFSGAATEFGRFTINTVWGIGGLLDPSSNKELDLQKQDNDLGQTLGFYGVGQGFYIVWPILGPSSPRDSIDTVGEYFLYPISYIYPWYSSLGVRTYEIINNTSLRIGDYESLKDAAIDPYVAMRDAYAQYRLKKVKARKAKLESAMSQDANSPKADQASQEK